MIFTAHEAFSYSVADGPQTTSKTGEIYFQKTAEKLTNAMLQHLRLNATIIAMKRSVLCSSKQYSASLVNRKEKKKPAVFSIKKGNEDV